MNTSWEKHRITCKNRNCLKCYLMFTTDKRLKESNELGSMKNLPRKQFNKAWDKRVERLRKGNSK